MTTDTPSTVTVRFFARLREQLDTDTLTVTIDTDATVADLQQQLASRGGPWLELTGNQPVLTAVNQAMAKPGTRLSHQDEVAFFPPVTGG